MIRRTVTIEIDPALGVAYVVLKEKAITAKTIKLGGEIVLDFDASGALIGIELLSAAWVTSLADA